MNNVNLLGRLGRDPEVRHTKGGTPVCTLRLATNEWKKNPDGGGERYAEWHNVVVWGKQAESCGQHLTKGREVGVQGRLQTRSWEDKEGNKRSTTEVVADRVEFIGGKGAGGSDGPSEPYEPPKDDDIPF